MKDILSKFLELDSEVQIPKIHPATSRKYAWISKKEIDRYKKAHPFSGPLTERIFPSIIKK
jgi:hypothetical protein